MAAPGGSMPEPELPEVLSLRARLRQWEADAGVMGAENLRLRGRLDRVERERDEALSREHGEHLRAEDAEAQCRELKAKLKALADRVYIDPSAEAQLATLRGQVDAFLEVWDLDEDDAEDLKPTVEALRG